MLWLILFNITQRKLKEFIIIESPGGDVNVAVKLVKILRAVFPKGFSVIVPSVAKSAATMLVLGADEIVVGPSSELG
jgi:ClpP class serine protease